MTNKLLKSVREYFLGTETLRGIEINKYRYIELAINDDKIREYKKRFNFRKYFDSIGGRITPNLLIATSIGSAYYNEKPSLLFIIIGAEAIRSQFIEGNNKRTEMEDNYLRNKLELLKNSGFLYVLNDKGEEWKTWQTN